MAESTSEDALLDGRVVLRQPTTGYRVAIDPVLLAAAVPACAGERVLDVGTGAGAAALCLASRMSECRVVGVEKERNLARLAADNVALNDFGDRVEIMIGDLGQPPPKLAPGSFDHVMANPPYFASNRGQSPSNRNKARSTVEGDSDLGDWVNYCLTMARPGATVTLIHRADRLGVLLGLLAAKAGDIVVFPLWPFDPFDPEHAKPPKRLIIQARAGSRAPLRLAGGIVLHRPGGDYTEAAERVLRDAAALPL